MQLHSSLVGLLALLAGASSAQGQNSTFQNPIISGFHPDPSCVFVPELDATWFCASSSFLAFPGLPIHASRDLVHWKHASNALSRHDQLPGLAFLPGATSGVYAPTLRFRRGVFYLTTTLVNQRLPRQNDSRWDNVLLTTADPYRSGAWSDPVHFSFPGYDPSIFWDDDDDDDDDDGDGTTTTTTYVSAAHTAAYYPGIMHAPLDLETGEVGDIRMPWNGTGGGASPEAPHVWKRRGGWYYLLLAEGGTRENHMVTMARTRDLLAGPYEPAPNNPLLTAANHTGSYFQAVGHADLFQDAGGQWWAVALAVRVAAAGGGGAYEKAPYAANFPMGRETVLTPVTWEEGGWPVFDPVAGEASGWPLPSPDEAVPEQGEGQLSGADDAVTFPPGSSLPIHFLHWRLPVARNYAVSPPGHRNSLALTSSVLNLTGFDGDFALGRGQTFVGRRMAHSLFRFRVDVDWAASLAKEEMEVGVSAVQDQAQHFDLGIVMLVGKPAATYSNDTGGRRAAGLQPHLRFRGYSETPYRAQRSSPSEVYPVPEEWIGQKLTLQIEAVNSTHFSFSAGPAGSDDQSQMRIFGYCRGDELVPYYSGVVLGVYATSNGKYGERAFETYISNWRYTGIRQFRSQEDVQSSDLSNR